MDLSGSVLGSGGHHDVPIQDAQIITEYSSAMYEMLGKLDDVKYKLQSIT